MKRKGFSAVEFLVVIVALGMLVALLFPAVMAIRKSNQKARVIQQEQSQGNFEVGDIAYLVLDGKKVQVIEVTSNKIYIRYLNDIGGLEEMGIKHFEIVDERPFIYDEKEQEKESSEKRQIP